MSKISDDVPCGFGKHQRKRLGDIDADYWAWCWNKFLHKSPEMIEHKYIVQEIHQLDKETDIVFVPDPRTM